MTTKQTSNNRVYLFRLQMLIIDGGLLVLRNILDQKLNVQNISLSACLNQEWSTITSLKRKKIVTEVQYDLLYPAPGGKPPSTADFDITLIICLLRNLKPCRLNQQFKWNVIPNTQDVSVEADIYRLKMYRNEISHISTTTGFQLKDFSVKWTEIEKILLRLNSSVINPVPNLQHIIDDLKKNPLDEEAEERIQKEVEAWRNLEKGVEVELRRANLDTQAIKEEMKNQQTHGRQMAAKVDEIEDDLRQEKKRRVDTGALQEEMKQQQIDGRQVAEKVDEIDKRTSEQTEILKDTQNKVDDLEQQISKSNDTKDKQKDLKEDLIVLYRKQYNTLPLSPLIEEQDAPLLKFYVMPDINTVEYQRSLGGGSESKSKITSLYDVFYKKGKACCDIYITADAGFGKTAFSKRLVLTWCQAIKGIKSEQKHFKEEDIRAMLEFECVFLLSLRECSEKCDIDEMIMKQIIPRLANTSVTLSNLETILCNERCLVILDGLDEWSHPTAACKQGPSDIPHRKARECTILTTTRPWKLSVMSLSSSQIEQKLEIVGLNEESAYELKKSVISLLCGKPEIAVEEHIDRFDFAVEEKAISDLETIPLLLMYLLCLWCDGIDLGRSKCDLYSQIVELLLKRTFKKYPHMQHADNPPQSDIPKCFSEHIHCKNNYSLLEALAHLAYERLFNKHKENTLVFDQSEAKQYLSQSYLDLCLFSGILTQSKEVKLTTQSSKVSFSHRSVQEYFCALYISCQNESDVKKIVLQTCSSVENILDISTVFVFISGIDAKMISSISRELMPLISADKIMSTYRSSTLDKYEDRKPVMDIQNMYISCCKENPDNNDLKLCCQDIIIDSDCREESHFTNVKQLAIHNKNNMQSIRIETGVTGINCSLHEIIDSCGLDHLDHLDHLFKIRKISRGGICTEEGLCRLLNRSAECVTVLSYHRDSSWSGELCKTFQNNSLLRAIYISRFKMSHDVMEQLLNCINRKSMVEIKLEILSCITHDGDRCPGFNIDLTQHSDLRRIELNRVPVKQLSLSHEMVNIEHVELWEVPMSASSLHGLVKSAEKLAHTVTVDLIRCIITPKTEVEDVRKYLKTLRKILVTDHSNLGSNEYSLKYSLEYNNLRQ